MWYKRGKLPAVVLLLIFLSCILGYIPSAKAKLPRYIPFESLPGLNFIEGSGDLTFTSDNKKASSGTRYRTVGWVIRIDDPDTSINEGLTCDDQGHKLADVYAQCTPTEGSYQTIPIGAFKSQDDSVKEYTDESGVIRVKTTFVMKGEDVDKYFRDGPLKDVQENTTVYFNALFQVVENGNLVGPIYETSKGIREARGWADDTGFRQYYDLPVEFHGMSWMQRRILKIQETGEKVEAKPFPDETLYKAGDDTKDVRLDSFIEYKGKSYVLKYSYIQGTNDNTPVYYPAEDPDHDKYYRRDASLLKRNPMMKAGGIDVIAVYGLPVDCKCGQSVLIPNKQEIEGKVNTPVLGKQVSMQINFTASSLDDWKLYLKNRTGIQMKVRLWRTNTGKNNIDALPKWSPVANAPDAEKFVPVTSEQLLAFLSNNPSLTYTDDLSNYPIPEDGVVSFRYNASIEIKSSLGGNEESKVCTQSDSATIAFSRPPPEYFGSYRSKPQYYSEVKQGSPSTSGTGSNEDFDAMAGTPTTRSLYFASGGSEFIVDIVTKYQPPVTVNRSYRSYFTAVTNGWAMSSISGGYQRDSAPPKPAARVITDACGQSYTETVSSKSQSYIKGYTTGKDPQPIMGTEYGWDQLGYDSHLVGGYEDTWTQSVTFDYIKIVKVNVWKLDRSKLTGMATLTGTNEINASVVQGDPNIFYNIAFSDTSAAGRLRYSLETGQHDAVTWNEGQSDNCLANSKAGPVNEQAKFTERRNMQNKATAVSDFLILQTSTGDQAVMYFQKDSNTAKSTEALTVPTTDFKTMWTNNPTSAAKWTETQINIGSYNGKYASPWSKYSGAAGATVQTIFDSMPAGLNRPARPGPYMRLMKTGIDVIDTLPNKEYPTGSSNVFYKLLLTYDPDNRGTIYSTEVDSLYGTQGQSFTSTYSPSHSKVNDIVIHDPVSVQRAMVVSLPASLDQRTPESVIPRVVEPEIEYEKQLDPNYRQNILPNPKAEAANEDSTIAGWNTWSSSGDANVRFTSRAGDSWVISDTRSFEINSTPNIGGSSGTNYVGVYYKDISIKPNTNYRFEGDISCHRCEGYFYIDLYNADGSPSTSGLWDGSVISSYNVVHKTISFTSGPSVNRARIHIVKGNGQADSVAGVAEYVFADNLKLMNMSVQEFIPVEPVFATKTIPNPGYKEASEGSNEVFSYTGAAQEFTAPVTGEYTLEAWGAGGGNAAYNGDSYGIRQGGRGSYSTGKVTLSAGQKLEVHVGERGLNGAESTGGCGYKISSVRGGWNGGGAGGAYSASGGGATDFRLNGARILVAGGGGGAGQQAWGGDGDLSGDIYNSNRGTGGGGQAGYYSSGIGGNGHETDDGGGGGGWYGGQGGQTGCGGDSGGGGGSSYVGTLTQTAVLQGNLVQPAPGGGTQTGNPGNGAARITSPAHPAEGVPTITMPVMAIPGTSGIPQEAYILTTKIVDSNAPSGGYSPGNFVLLDYGFKVYFPNKGDFLGNSAYGIPATTGERGKGFVNDMDTTEWTKAKYAKFNFNVIYNDVMYLAGAWIPLNVAQTEFDFYLPLGNKERRDAAVEFKSVAINGSFDNELSTNRVRYTNNNIKYGALHSAYKETFVDIVGRIGNMVIEDTGDFRFSNLFKKPAVPDQWLIPNVIKKVNIKNPYYIIGDKVNIRGEAVSGNTQFLNTYGTLPHLGQDPIPFPLSPEKNNISALKNQPLRMGYNILSDIQTIGNYYNNMQVVPYYYSLDLQSGKIEPVDIYMNENGQLRLINKNGAVYPGWNPAAVYPFHVFLDWDREAERRNYSADEEDITDRVVMYAINTGADTETGRGAQPGGIYDSGTAQLLALTGNNRTYIGNTSTNGWDKNPGYKLLPIKYEEQAQRWHFTFALPSSAVAVPSGQLPAQSNVDSIRNNTHVLILAADIRAVGDTYTLKYSGAAPNGMLAIAGTSWSTGSIPYPVVAVYSANKSSADDLDVFGTH